ncbi:hypothetical protein [Pimelobacter simplex]
MDALLVITHLVAAVGGALIGWSMRVSATEVTNRAAISQRLRLGR